MTHALFPMMDSIDSSSSQARFGWKRQSVHQFFSPINWDDQPPEAQKFQQASEDGLTRSLLLTVSQFFSTVNWEGNSAQPQELLPAANLNLGNAIESASMADLFTLDQFSDLF